MDFVIHCTEGRVALALVTSSVTVGGFLLFYSGFDKKTGELRIAKKVPPILRFHSSSYSLRELNKVAALSGMALLGSSFLVPEPWGGDLQKSATTLLLAHGAFSSTAFYDFSIKRLLVENRRWVGIVAGQSALMMLLADGWGYPAVALSTASLALGMMHFGLMELKPGPYTGRVEVRPFGWLAVVSGVAGLCSVCAKCIA